MQPFLDWLTSLEWNRLLPELIGKMLGFLAGFGASWFLLFRKRLNALQRLKRGDSDDVIFQMHCLCELPDGEGNALVFRNLAPKTTVESLYDNPAAQQLVKTLADGTTLHDPVLQTKGTLGFEVLNDAAGHIAGLLATTPYDRETWLFAMTCEDRQMVRKKCIRCFLIRPDDLRKFGDWQWCCQTLHLESPWHWFRVVALHRLAVKWLNQEQGKTERPATDMPLVNSEVQHDRIRRLSLGINRKEKPIRKPIAVNWAAHHSQLLKLGLEMPRDEVKEEPTAE